MRSRVEFPQWLAGREKTAVLLVLIISFIVQLLLVPIPGYKIDHGSFLYWYNHASSGNFSSFYEPPNWSDYPPFNVYIFWFFGNLLLKPALFLQSLFSTSPPVVRIISEFAAKLPAIFFNLALTAVIYHFLRRRFSFQLAVTATSLYAFNPAVIYDLAVWGQMDSVYSLFMVASLVLLLNRKYEFSSMLLAVGLLTKPQSVILLPFLLYMLLKERRWWRFLSCGLLSALTVFLIALPFSHGNPVSFLIAIYQQAYTVYPFTSINAYNFWAVVGGPWQFWQPDSREFLFLALRSWGIILFTLFTLLVLWRFHRKFSEGNLIFSLFLISFGFFFLMTRMHERYIFLTLPLLTLGLAYVPRLKWIYGALSLTLFGTLAYILPVLNSDRFVEKGDLSFFIFVPAYFLLLVWSVWVFFTDKGGVDRSPAERDESVPPRTDSAAAGPGEGLQPHHEPDAPDKTPDTLKSESVPLKKHWPVILLCLVFFVLSSWNLGSNSMPETVWKPQDGGAEIYLELEKGTHLDSLYLFVMDDRQVNVEVRAGEPGFWVKVGELKTQGTWKQWPRVSLNLDTKYLDLVFTDTSAEIGEIVLFSNGKPERIAKVVPVRGGNGQEALIDEPQVLTSLPSFKDQSYFDEVYFARAAEEYLNNKVPFEWSHPPLGKVIMSSGVIVLGPNPFGWRITGVIISIATILLVYLIGMRMFGMRGAWIAAFLLSFDFMHFAESRLATGEHFVFFFVVLIFFFFLRYYQDPDRGRLFLFLSLVAFGLGFATKWITANSLIGLLILLAIVRGKKIFQKRDTAALILGGLSAGLVYFLSYIPDLLVGRHVKDLWSLQVSMYGYHANLKEGHPFGSPWWGWPLSFRPLWLYSGDLEGKLSEIVLLGNPALWWGSIPALVFTGWLALRKGDKYAWFILVPYLTQWLLYSPLSRVLFIYHFYPDVLFVVLATTLFITRMWTRHKKWCIAYLGLNLALFIFAFPIISGLPMPNAYWDWLKNLVLMPK